MDVVVEEVGGAVVAEEAGVDSVGVAADQVEEGDLVAVLDRPAETAVGAGHQLEARHRSAVPHRLNQDHRCQAPVLAHDRILVEEILVQEVDHRCSLEVAQTSEMDRRLAEIVLRLCRAIRDRAGQAGLDQDKGSVRVLASPIAPEPDRESEADLASRSCQLNYLVWDKRDSDHDCRIKGHVSRTGWQIDHSRWRTVEPA